MPLAKRIPAKSNESDLETGEPDQALDRPAESRAVGGSVWMIVISSAFYFLPVANGVVAGIIGGFRLGSTRLAITGAAGALLFTTAISWMLFTALPIPLMGSHVDQVQIAILITLSGIGLLIGAGIGGTIAQNRIDRFNRA
jgi:hypothetical protein